MSSYHQTICCAFYLPLAHVFIDLAPWLSLYLYSCHCLWWLQDPRRWPPTTLPLLSWCLNAGILLLHSATTTESQTDLVIITAPLKFHSHHPRWTITNYLPSSVILGLLLPESFDPIEILNPALFFTVLHHPFLFTQAGFQGLVLKLLCDSLVLLYPPAKIPASVKPSGIPLLHLCLGTGTWLEKTPTTAQTGLVLNVSLQISGLLQHCPATLQAYYSPRSLCPSSRWLFVPSLFSSDLLNLPGSQLMISSSYLLRK